MSLDNPTEARRPIAVMGPTGSGKSQTALELAKALDGEIVNCDSVQVYRGFNIGCAKPTKTDLNTVPHHLIDIAKWDERYDANRFRQDARAVIADIQNRGKQPIICGGTGLYLRVLRWGVVDAPSANPELRGLFERQEKEQPGSLFTDLQTLDPASAAQIGPQNIRQIIRALEISKLSGRPASAIRAEHGFRGEETPMQVYVLQWPADILRERIQSRAEAMVAQGLVREVEALLEAGVHRDCTPMRSVGYRETVDVISGYSKTNELADRIAKSTWDYARRQRTWFRKEKLTHDIDASSPTTTAQAIIQALS